MTFEEYQKMARRINKLEKERDRYVEKCIEQGVLLVRYKMVIDSLTGVVRNLRKTGFFG